MTKEEIRFRVKTSVQAREQILTVDNLGDWDATGSAIRIETTKVMSTWYVTVIYSTKRTSGSRIESNTPDKINIGIANGDTVLIYPLNTYGAN